jgi:hypothetical protein
LPNQPSAGKEPDMAASFELWKEIGRITGSRRSFCILLGELGLLLRSGAAAARDSVEPIKIERLASFYAREAYQAAAADELYVYAIDDHVIAKYERSSRHLLAKSAGTAHHLNSGFFWEGKLYCAHATSDGRNEIVMLDPERMTLTSVRDLSEHPGKITWVVREPGLWWVGFGFYGRDNAKTYLAKLDESWHELRRWSYPSRLIPDLGGQSISGGIFRNGLLLATGHDKKVVYRLALADDSDVLELVDAIPAPFTGQGIAADPKTGGLVGIDRRRREVIFASVTASR